MEKKHTHILWVTDSKETKSNDQNPMTKPVDKKFLVRRVEETKSND